MNERRIASRFMPGLLSRIESPRKVVVLRASRIGDFVCATPAFRVLREALPQAEITLVALPMVQSLVTRNTALDRFFPFPGWPGIAEQFYRPEQARAAIAQLRAQRFDLGIQMHGSGVFANPFMRALHARVTAGFIRANDTGRGLDAALVLPDGNERERLLSLMRFLGVRVGSSVRLEFRLLSDDHARAQRLLHGLPRPLIGIHPDARDQIRRWPLERFFAAGQMLAKSMRGTMVVVGEGRGETMNGNFVRDLRGRTSLPVLGAVLARLAVLITNDTGPAHIAYALAVPSVTIFGGTDPAQWGPPAGPHRVLMHAIDCRPCDIACCPIGNRCLSRVSVEHVCDAARNAMRDDQRSSHGQ